MKQAAPIVITGAINTHDDDCACPDHAFVLEYHDGYAGMGHDCACPGYAFCSNPKDQLPPAKTYQQTPDTHVQPLPNDHYLAYSPYAPGGPSVLNRPAWERWQAFATPQPLQESADAQLAAQKLVLPVNARPQPRHTQGETLTAWLHVTNACNLDCPYCYVRKSSARMTEATGLLAVRQIFKTAVQHNFRQVKLKYAGGEATLHFKLVRQLHAEARRLAQAHALGLREVLLSNGVHLRPADAAWLAASGVKLMISLDGVGETHDRQRPLRGGGSTFAQIERTVDQLLLSRGVRPDVTITITRLNAHGVDAAVRWALARDLPVSLNFYRQNLLTANRRELELEEEAIIDGMLRAYAVFEQALPERPFFNGLLDRVQAEAHAHTCGVQHSYLVITHEGKLAQCQMHLDAPVGPSLDGDLLALADAGPIQNIAVDAKEGCRACTFRYRCTGGCPLETYRATGRWDVRSPHCRIYKTLLPAAARLEGLRLLKIHGLLT